jgi:hypothetical protein
MKDYIAVNYGIGGYFAVYMSYDKDCGCYMPWQSGMGHYKTREEAEAEARAWAEAEGLDDEEEEDWDEIMETMIRTDPGHAIPGYNTPLF